MGITTNEIATQTKSAYLDHLKIKGFEDVGYFLVPYVVSGGYVTKNIKRNDAIDISEIVAVLDDDVDLRGTAEGIRIKYSNSTYFVDFYEGDFWVNTAHPAGVAGVDYLTLATLTTDAFGNVGTVTDTAGIRGGFRLKSEYGLSGYMRPVFNVLDYGAVSDGITDNTEKIQNAIDAAAAVKGTVFIPPGEFVVTQLNINSAVKIQGIDASVSGSKLVSLTNAPIFYVTQPCTIEDINITGAWNDAFTLQDGIFIDNTNDVYIRNVFIAACYNGVHIKDTVFYTYFDNVRFYSAKNALMYGEGTSSGGYAIQINNCQATIDSAKYGFFFKNVGSIIIDSLLMSPGNATDAGMIIESLATFAGIQQISNSVFEGTSAGIGVRLIGTPSNPIKSVYFSNTYFIGQPAIEMDQCKRIFFDNCYISGTRGVAVKGSVENISLVNCEFQTLDAPFSADNSNTINGLNIVNPIYEGGSSFLYFPNIPITQIGNIKVSGGKIGINAKPIDVSMPITIDVDVSGYTITSNKGKLTTSGDGTTKIFSFTHGLIGTPSYANVVSGNGVAGAAVVKYVNVNATSVTVEFNTAPAAGTNNVELFWEAKI